MTTHIQLARASAALCLGLALAACGAPASQTDPTTGPTTGTTPVDTTPTTPAGPLVVGQATAFATLDPAQAGKVRAEPEIVRLVFDNLVRFNTDMSLSPGLAESWSVAEDGLTWTFNLRSGVKFHDGTDFTADAVKFTFERLVDPDAGFLNAGLFASVIASVDVVDPLTVNIVTTRPFGPFLNYLAHFSAGIVSPAAVNQQGNAFGLNPVGTGAYTVTAVDAGQSVTLQRNDDYWGDAPASEQITFRSITDDNTRVAAVQSGQVGIGTGLPVQSIEALEADGMTVTIIKGMQAQYVGINTTRPQLSNPAIRQALNYAIDTASISEGLFFGANEPLQSVFTEGTFGYQAQATSYDFDQAKAVALLAGAGITADNPLHLVLWAPQGLYPQDSLLAQAIQSQLAEVNVEVEIVQQQSSNYFTVLKEQSDYDLFLWAFVPSTGDGYQTLQNNVLSNTGDTPDYFNFMRYSNPDLDELINRAGTETDQDQRRSDLQAAQEIIWNDAPYIFLYNIGIVTGSRPDVQGVEALPIGYLSLSGTHQ